MNRIQLTADDDMSVCTCHVLVEQVNELVTATAVFSFATSCDKRQNFADKATEIKEEDINNQERRLVKRVFYKALLKTGGQKSPWGILTGIRPTKLVHRLLDRQLGLQDIQDYLTGKYLLTPEKADLLTSIAWRQRGFLPSKDQTEKKIGLYVGIPFCPTRCNYCSFPAFSTAGNEHLKKDFLAALHREIEVIGREVAMQKLQVEHIYLGGGTPTSLTTVELDEILNKINYWFRSDHTKEVTVEGGRPDTLTKDMLKLLAEHHVNRISVNPQTLQDKTLKLIGREHTAADFWQAFYLAKDMGFPIINVDLIIGLPEENVLDVEDTLKKLAQVQLDNLTVHCLSLKRGSKLIDTQQEHVNIDQEAAKMADLTGQFAKHQGLNPYYLYRQKRILGLGENIGYSLPNLESIYNIQIMEERQTIIGLGCGASSKWVDPTDQTYWTLTATYNPKDPYTYIDKIEDLTAKKIHMLNKEGEYNADYST